MPMQATPSFLSSITRPVDADHLEAVLKRAEELKESSRPYLFQDWLDDQYHWDLDLGELDHRTAQRFLYNHGGNIQCALSPHVISVALAIAERWGWDPHFQDEFPDESRNSQTVFEDETFLEWLTVHHDHGISMGRVGSSLANDLFWPITQESFVAFDAQHQPVRDLEWLMAMTIASGSNPWFQQREERRELALQNCVGTYPKIAHQLLRLPGAPTLRELLEQSYFYKDHRTLSGYLFSRENPGPMLSNLVQAAPGFKYTLDETVKLSLHLFEQAVALDLLPDIPREDLVSHLRNQLNAIGGTYGPKGFIERVELLFPQTGVLPEEQADLVTQSLLDGETWGGNLSRTGLLEQQACGATWLCQKTRVEGPWAGNWSVFNAHVFSAVCEAEHTGNTYGVNRLPWEVWLFDERPDTFFREATVEKTYPELAQLLNEDLENGLPVAGLWTLALLGKSFYKQDKPSFFPTTAAPGQTHQPLIRVERLANEAVALGIDNLQHFFDQHREAAVEASEWLMAHAPALQRQNACTALQRVWGRCWKRHPSWMEGHPELVTRLVRLLSVGFQPAWTNEKEGQAWKHPWTDVLFNLPALFPREFSGRISQLSPLNLAYILALHKPSEMEDAIEWLEQAPSPDSHMLSWVREWLPDHGGLTPEERKASNYPLSQELIGRLTAAVLEHHYPETDRETVRERL